MAKTMLLPLPQPPLFSRSHEYRRHIWLQRNPTTPTIENSTTTTSPTANASRYRRRDAHEAFFRSRSKTSRHQVRMRRQKAKPRVLTDKERTQWAREHYELHHEMPAISGYHRHISDDDETTTFTDHTIPLTPTSIESMFKYAYHDDICIHHDNLRNLTIRAYERIVYINSYVQSLAFKLLKLIYLCKINQTHLLLLLLIHRKRTGLQL